MDDRELFAAGYNRVYDSLEPETNLDHVEEVMQHILENWDRGRCAVQLEDQSEDRRVSFEAYEGARNFEDVLRAQGAGVCAGVHGFRAGDRRGAAPAAAEEGGTEAACALIRIEDFEYYAATMLATKRMGIFTIGGGVPRNWAQQFGVYAELLARRGYEKLPLKRYNYGVRICPEPVNWGGLSGSTYTEAVSWGKFVPPEEGGRFAEVLDDATVALPLIVGAVLERIGYLKKR